LLIIFGLLSAGFSGCVSPEEQKAREENAFNLEGQYKPHFSEGIETELAIINQGHRSNAAVEFTRKGEFTAEEKQKFEEVGLLIDKVSETFLNKKVLMKGWDDSSNESSDFGKTSKMNVCSTSYSQAIDKVETTPNGLIKWTQVSLKYCIRLKAVKDTAKISGTLSSEIKMTGQGPRKNLETDKYEFGDLSESKFGPQYNFSADMIGGFANQYIGLWNGKVENTSDNYLSQLVGLNFTAKAENQYGVDLMFRIIRSDMATTEASQTLQFKGETFTVNEAETQLDFSEVLPEILITLSAPSGAELVLVATVWNLSSLKGNAIYVKDGTEDVVGSLSFTKK
ncbi:MAG: hypothetical protein KDD22_04310, partial [Bdellovibrionales bacterium]|nr:hypothetical protein [Bdellovibrionales bacterium]